MNRLTGFVPGLELSRGFYHDCVAPIIDSEFPRLAYTAALIGTGSDVLGFDTERSTDHHWGPRLYLYVRPADVGLRARIIELLAQRLPVAYRGYSTNFTRAEDDPEGKGIRLMSAVEHGPVNHMVNVAEIGRALTSWLGFDPRDEVTLANWLSSASERLLEMTSGEVFHDGLGDLTSVRAKLAWYPHDVWLHMLAAQWARIAEEEAFVGRCAEVGDELGSAVVASRLVRDLMRVCFLMERRYAPYSKWLGTGFARLACGPGLEPVLRGAVAAPDYPTRERHLSEAYEYAARMHNHLAVTDPLEPTVGPFFDRPFKVIFARRYVEVLREAISDPEIRALSRDIGGIDQWVDNTLVSSSADFAQRVGGFAVADIR